MPYSMAYYNGSTTTTYYFITNLQGDVIELRLADNTYIARYEYDAWGKLLSVKDGSGNEITDASHVGLINPIRYRGYYYDAETGLYYLMSRYYDPAVGRFINPDGYISTGQGILGHNMFAYCGNNGVNKVDYTGCFWNELWSFAQTTIIETGKAMGVMTPVYAGCGGMAVADGPLPFGDIAAVAGVAALTVTSIGFGFYQSIKSGQTISVPKSETNAKVEEITGSIPKHENYNYWSASIYKKNFSVGLPLTAEQACMSVSMGFSVMCRDEAAAKYIIYTNGYRNAVGPERHENGFLHYHPTRNHTGYKSIHIWFYD